MIYGKLKCSDEIYLCTKLEFGPFVLFVIFTMYHMQLRSNQFQWFHKLADVDTFEAKKLNFYVFFEVGSGSGEKTK